MSGLGANRIVDPQKRTRALFQVQNFLALRPGDIVRFDVAFPSGQDHFVARVDWAPTRGGGYQMFEGVLDGSTDMATPVLGRGRVTPRMPLKQTGIKVKTPEEVEEERRQLDMELEFNLSLIDEERSR